MTSAPEPHVSSAVEQMATDLRTDRPPVPGVPSEMVDAAVRAGFQTAVGTIAFAGYNVSGSHSVQFNVQDGGGYSSSWPQWAFELAKDALLGSKRVWVASNGDPFG
ncbi:hypothetical protein [Kocuria sp. NPDC057446]|uniref:hypothetical protein n=1 Tax=Kocuria sp. NPDC057446 TaxID=3346137 RepID=UPI00368C8E48